MCRTCLRVGWRMGACSRSPTSTTSISGWRRSIQGPARARPSTAAAGISSWQARRSTVACRSGP
jgi:hypothetical protein